MNMAKKQKRIFTTGNPDSRGTHKAHDVLEKEENLEKEYEEFLKHNEPQELIKKQERLKKEIEDKKYELKEAEKEEKTPESSSSRMYSHRQIKGPPKVDANTGKVLKRIIDSGDKGLTEDEILGYTLLSETDQMLPRDLKRRKVKELAKEKNVPIMSYQSNFKREMGIVNSGSIERKGLVVFDPIKKTYVANKHHKNYHEFVSSEQRKKEREEQIKRELGEHK